MSNVKIIELLKGIREGVASRAIDVNDSVLIMLNNIGVNVEGIKKERTNIMPYTTPTSTLIVDAPKTEMGNAYTLTNNTYK